MPFPFTDVFIPSPSKCYLKDLDNIRSSLLWQGNKERKGFYLVKWKALTVSKKKGGLGLRDLKFQNKALKIKWLWRCTLEDQMLWIKAIKEKYELEDRWMTKEINTPYGVSLWRSIRILWPLLKNRSSIDDSETAFLEG